MRDLSEFNIYLSEDGKRFLAKWGIKLAGLYEDSLKPSHPNESHFVEVFRHGKSPEGISETIWFNIVAINQLIEKCASIEYSLENEKSIKRGLIKRINNQEGEIKKTGRSS